MDCSKNSIYTRKTSINRRGTYTYKFADGEKVELFPGAGGIDEEIILTLHRMDDNEISQYYRKGKAPISEAVKEEKALWRKKFISKFIEKYGYSPDKDYVDFTMEQRFPKAWNLSLDVAPDDEGANEDKSLLLYQAAQPECVADNIAYERLKEHIQKLTPKQQQVLDLVMVLGYSQTEVADMLGISIPAVNKHLKKALAYLRKNEKNILG